ncbi:MAG: hypothetical protein ACR2PF_13520 [Rhizobiaceae bacterium]
MNSLITGLPFEPLGILIIMMAILILLGFVMDWIGILMLTMPIFVPLSKGLATIPFGLEFCSA